VLAWSPRLAARLLGGLLVVLTLVVVGPASAQAAQDEASPTCPTTVADQPLSVTAPFSGTTRPQADGDGTIVATSLLCAYGEGVEPSATMTVTWTTTGDACHDVDVAVASALDTAPFTRAATDLARGLGPACAAPTRGLVRPAAIAGAIGAAATALVLIRRRRRRPVRPLAVSAPAPFAVGSPPTPAEEIPRPARPGTLPDLAPVIAAFAGSGGRAFARTGPGQMAAVAALAYAAGDTVVGDLARAGSLQGQAGRRPPRPEVTALARALAHHGLAVDR
jgi:hypothetical protein